MDLLMNRNMLLKKKSTKTSIRNSTSLLLSLKEKDDDQLIKLSGINSV